MSKQRLFLFIAGLLALILVVVFTRMRPWAPQKLDLYAGPQGSHSHDYATSYAKELEEAGITVRVVATQGEADNLKRLLEAPTRSIALIQSGMEQNDGEIASSLASLGSVAPEPLWLFVHKESQIKQVNDLAGKKVALGPKGSGSREVAELILHAHQLLDQVDTQTTDGLLTDVSIQQLIDGKIDALFILSPPHAKPLERLTEAKQVSPIAFDQADAYALRFPFLAKVNAPRGSGSLAENRPPQDVKLVAAVLNLVVTDEIHPTLVERLVSAARRVKLKSVIIPDGGKFPTMDYASLPIHPRASSVYLDGPSMSGRTLPYWLAALIDQLMYVIIPALTIPFALLKAAPSILTVRFNIYKKGISKQIVQIERRLLNGDDPAELKATLLQLSQETLQKKVPAKLAADYIELRQSIHDTMERIPER
jgi:TRAP transporter TAXI family solute receptor